MSSERSCLPGFAANILSEVLLDASTSGSAASGAAQMDVHTVSRCRVKGGQGKQKRDTPLCRGVSAQSSAPSLMIGPAA